MSWLIAIPAWGDRCIWHLFNRALPAVGRALDLDRDGPHRFVIHTDRVGEVEPLCRGLPRVAVLPLPQHRASRYYTLSDCHRQAIDMSKPGEFIALLNADHTPSIECFHAAAKRFHEGKRMIMMAGMRTMPEPSPPIGVSARELLKWGWQHRHPTVEDAIWGSGKSTSLSMLFFAAVTPIGGEQVVLRAFHLHPFAFVKHAGLKFDGLTIDEDLAEAWSAEQIHVVVSADEAALVEQSPAEFAFKSHQKPVAIRDVAFWAHGENGHGGKRTSALHHWLFRHRIVVKGHGHDLGDEAVANAILSIIPHAVAA
jgi:hypothetical protein